MLEFGTQYWRPPTPLRGNWKKDLQLMKKHGFTIMRAWAMWAWHNPKEGKYDFSEILELLDLADKNGLKVIVLTWLESCPGWVYRKWPESVFVSWKDKKEYPHTVHSAAVGNCPGLCLDHAPVKKEAERYLKALVKAVSSHPAFYGWEPHNEPLYEPSRYAISEIYCYCDGTVAAFKRWLKKKYRTIDALNAVWQRRLGDFAEVIPPRELGSYPDWYDWREFAIQALTEDTRWRASVLRKNDPKHTVMLHTRAGSAYRNIAADCTDDWRLGQIVEKFGYANFPQGADTYQHLLAGDVCRGAAGGKEFWLHELQSGPCGVQLIRDNPISIDKDIEPTVEEMEKLLALPPERIALWTWMSIAQGAKGDIYWQFRPEQFGTEYGYNLVDLDGTPTGRLEMAGRIVACLREHEELFDAMQPEPAKVAIAFSTDNCLMNFFNELHAKDYWQSYIGLSRLLAQAGYPMDIVRADAVVDDDYSRYEVIYLPMPNFLNGKVAKRLAAYVRGGGTLVSEPSLAQYADDFFSSSIVPGMGMDKVFGCRREDIRSLPTVPLKWKSLQLNGTFYKEILEPRGARVRAKYPDGKAAVTENAYGRGRAIYFGTNVFNAYCDNADKNLIKVVQEINRPAKQDVWTDSSDTIVRVLSACGKRVIFVFNAVNAKTRASLKIAGRVKSLPDIFQKDKVTFKAEKGVSTARLQLEPYQTRILVMDAGE